MDWKTYKYHQKTRWKFYKDEVLVICRHDGRQYYDRSDGKTKCSKCKKEVL